MMDQQPATRDEFAQKFIDALKDAGDPRDIEYDSAEFRLIFREDDDIEGVANLRNMFDDFRAARVEDRAQCLLSQIRGVLSQFKQVPSEFRDAAPDLRPRIWPRCTFEKMQLQQQIDGNHDIDIPMLPVGDHLVATLVFDLPESVRTLDGESLGDWNVTFYEAMELARDNLAQAQFTVAQLGDGLYGSATGDTYDASRMLLTEFIQSLEVQGDLIAMAPNRDMLLITGSNDMEGLEGMHKLASHALQESPRPLVATPLRFCSRENEWQEWRLPDDHPLFGDYHRLEVEWLHQEYAEQKQLLDAFHEKQQLDVFVASFLALEHEESGNFESYCIWAEGVDSLLPKTDRVALGRGGDSVVAFVPWQRVEELCGHLMDETADYPTRYRVREFPDDSIVKTLENESFEF